MKKSLFILTIIFIFTGCQNLFNSKMLKDKRQMESIENIFVSGDQIVYGEKIENPFSILNVRTVNPEVSTNTIYFRVKPKSHDDLNVLFERFGELNLIRYDYEIISGSDPYAGNENNPENFNLWYYYIRTVEEYNNLSEIMETEIIDEMYVENIEEVLATGGMISEIETDDEEEDSRAIVYKRASGKISVYDTVSAQYVASGDVKIRVYQWCYYWEATTKDGYFSMPTSNAAFSSFFGNPGIKIIYENDYAEVRSLDSFFIGTASTVVGHKKVSQLANMEIKLKNKKDIQYMAALRSTQYMTEAGLLSKNGKIRFWVVPEGNIGGCTVMANHDEALRWGLYKTAIHGTALAGGVSVLGGATLNTTTVGLFTTAATVATAYSILNCPDVIFGSNSESLSANTAIVVHELSHVAHYNFLDKNGCGNSFWNEVINDYVSLFLSQIFKGKEPVPDCSTDISKLCESWATFYGAYCMDNLNGFCKGLGKKDSKGKRNISDKIYPDDYSFVSCSENNQFSYDKIIFMGNFTKYKGYYGEIDKNYPEYHNDCLISEYDLFYGCITYGRHMNKLYFFLKKKDNSLSPNFILNQFIEKRNVISEVYSQDGQCHTVSQEVKVVTRSMESFRKMILKTGKINEKEYEEIFFGDLYIYPNQKENKGAE